MNKGSLLKSNRCVGFATLLKGGCEMFHGSLINRLARSVASLVLVAAIGHLTAAGEVRAAAAPQPSHQDIQNSVDAVQNTVDSIETKVNNVKSKLDLIPPAWSQTLPVADRFQLVMGGAAVLDKETGLVWEKSPDTTTRQWHVAIFHCLNREVGSRKGWRLPTVEELASLVDTSNSNPALPTGHPFTLTTGAYWSATTYVVTSDAWAVGLAFGVVSNAGSSGKLTSFFTWCVRAGQGLDGVGIQ